MKRRLKLRDEIIVDGKKVIVMAIYPKTDQVVVKWPSGEETYRRLSELEK